MIYLILIFSFLFESAFSNIIPKTSFLSPIFLLTSLVLLYPYFKNKYLNFILVCIFCGLFYDICFTNSLFINTLIFFLSSFLIILGFNYINYNIYSSNILNLIIIVIYRFISYILLCVVDYISFNKIILSGIYNSILANIIYGIIMYIIINLIAKIFNIKKSD